jgi:putative addiction module killer protein
MYEVLITTTYQKWFQSLSDAKTRSRIDSRIFRLSEGNPGDVKPVGDGVSEMRLDFGPGYRIYFTRRGKAFVILLAGGDKGSQSKDIEVAKGLAQALKEKA